MCVCGGVVGWGGTCKERLVRLLKWHGVGRGTAVRWACRAHTACQPCKPATPPPHPTPPHPTPPTPPPPPPAVLLSPSLTLVLVSTVVRSMGAWDTAACMDVGGVGGCCVRCLPACVPVGLHGEAGMQAQQRQATDNNRHRPPVAAPRGDPLACVCLPSPCVQAAPRCGSSAPCSCRSECPTISWGAWQARHSTRSSRLQCIHAFLAFPATCRLCPQARWPRAHWPCLPLPCQCSRGGSAVHSG